nr:hypothetical protein Iba_chr01cCG8080 [Ipomoea batatas]
MNEVLPVSAYSRPGGKDHPRLPCVGENPTRFNHRASIPDWFQLVFLPSSVVDQLIFTQLNTHHISSLALLAYPHLGFQRINLPGGHRVPEEYPGTPWKVVDESAAAAEDRREVSIREPENAVEAAIEGRKSFWKWQRQINLEIRMQGNRESRRN